MASIYTDIDEMMKGREVTFIKNGRLDTSPGAGVAALNYFLHTFTDLVVTPGLISLNYGEVEAILKGDGPVLIGIGEGQGDCGAMRAAELAMPNSMPEVSMLRHAPQVLFHLAGNIDASDASKVGDYLEQLSGGYTEIIEGVSEDDTLDEVIVTVIASGLPELSTGASCSKP